MLLVNYLTGYVLYNLINRRSPLDFGGGNNTEVNVHATWAPTAHCDSFCMVTAAKKSGVWTVCGNTTMDGVYHDVHVTHNGNGTYGLRSWEGGYPGNNVASRRLAERQKWQYCLGLIAVPTTYAILRSRRPSSLHVSIRGGEQCCCLLCRFQR